MFVGISIHLSINFSTLNLFQKPWCSLLMLDAIFKFRVLSKFEKLKNDKKQTLLTLFIKNNFRTAIW